MAGSDIKLDDKLHWYKDAIIYELHIKAFRDGNGDGIGDFQGLLERLDYLQELGVTAIWVLPFYPSPLRDDGYDIADYYNINPSYGTIRQFRQFLEEAHKRNLKVITELVINHTSDQHPWFQRARTAPKGSPEREFYVWTDDPTQYKDVRIIFQDFEASNWTWDPVAGQYYWHRFFHHQPDLNYDSPQVQEEVFKIIDYWCAMGVDGFRLDAVPYLYEREGTNGENLPETHVFLKKLRKHVDDHFPGVVFLAEANMWPEDSASYFGDGDECHMNYHFPVMPRMFMALQMEDRYPITDIFEQTPAIPPTCQWAMFLRNHDELTLEMVTDEERDYMYKTYAKDPKARINLGIRHRLAPLMDNNRRKIELLNSLLFSLPGTPVLYYGDEIGMGDNFYLGDRDGVRTPMQWSPDRNAGFSSANPQKLYLPTILDPEYHYESVNVEMQRRNTSSLFWFTKRMINLRKKYKAFGRGDLTFLNVENPKVLAFTRRYEDEILLIVVNLSKYAQPAEIDLSDFKGYCLTEAFSRNQFPPVRDTGAYLFTLASFDYQWFVLEPTCPDAVPVESLPSLEVNTWRDLLSPDFRERMETRILPEYLQRVAWFDGKDRNLHGVSVVETVPVPLAETKAYLLLIETTYGRGLPDRYQLPVALARDPEAARLLETSPQAVLAQVRSGEETAVLCDALYIEEFQKVMLNRMAGEPEGAGPDEKLAFNDGTALKNFLEETPEVRPKVVAATPSYIAVGYNNCYQLKMYRKVDQVANPDVEISRYLAGKDGFAHVLPFVGTVELRSGGPALTLGMMQEMAENHGDGQSYMLERINNYLERILARDLSEVNPGQRRGSLIRPVGFDELAPEVQDLLGPRAADQVRRFGECTARMHQALAAGDGQKDFAPENFSLHYQRALFSGFQSLVRETFQNRRRSGLPDDVRAEAETLLERKNELLGLLKRIYAKKLDAGKIRIHGNLTLDKMMMTGKGIVIQDFGGDPGRSYSERRLKRSPLRDVAYLVHSLYYAAYEGFRNNIQVPEEETKQLLPFADFWAHSMSGFFTKAYFSTLGSSSILPDQPEDLELMLDTYLLEKALMDLNQELNHRPDYVGIPLRILRQLMPLRPAGQDLTAG
ncbi:maltose alpha-D-glucosyltransferase [Larkinella soli]|uniref:maltose alpha-D-glucosyltransferase n=1 Tax=Larkinella soli TaxID=1770527 RepID=UPI000FFBE755|nr:maltose alpha-D-glucosyltransferase [Larkinella soli]